jgi:hypothetical protein
VSPAIRIGYPRPHGSTPIRSTGLWFEYPEESVRIRRGHEAGRFHQTVRGQDTVGPSRERVPHPRTGRNVRRGSDAVEDPRFALPGQPDVIDALAAAEQGQVVP